MRKSRTSRVSSRGASRVSAGPAGRGKRSTDDQATFRDRVAAAVRAIPRGRVASYGGVAAVVGQPRAARAVGRVLAELDDDTLPWWRVVNRNGQISARPALHATTLQRKLLEREGVRFDRRGCIDWERFGWDGRGVSNGRESEGV